MASRSRSRSPQRRATELRVEVAALRRRFAEARETLALHGSERCQQTHFAEELVELAEGGAAARLREASLHLGEAERLRAEAPTTGRSAELRRLARGAEKLAARIVREVRRTEDEIWERL